MSPETLKTERLILRRAKENDADILFRNYFSDPVSSRYLTRTHHLNINQTKDFLRKWCVESWEREENSFAWVVALVDSNEAIGIFLVDVNADKSAKIHYGLGRDFSKKGLITEAGYEVIQWLIHCQVRKIWTECDLENLGSIRVLEKLGFRNEGITKNKLVFPALGDNARDCCLYVYDCVGKYCP